MTVVGTLNGTKHLPTNECGLDVIKLENQDNTLRFTACLSHSCMKFVKYNVSRENDKIFIDIYGRWFTNYSNFSRSFDYSLPSGIDEVYLRGENSEDIKLIWKRY